MKRGEGESGEKEKRIGHVSLTRCSIESETACARKKLESDSLYTFIIFQIHDFISCTSKSFFIHTEYF